MKIFISSTMHDLQDARLLFINNLQKKCNASISLISYETEKHKHPQLSPEETCIKLAQESNAILFIADKYYGTPYSRDKNISITHAEILEGLKNHITIIPIIRTQTWYEFLVWRKNQGQEICFDYVVEPKLFRIIEALSKISNCQDYKNFTDDDCLEKIGISLNSVTNNGSINVTDHTILPIEENSSITRKNYPFFTDKQVLHASQLNKLYELICMTAKNYGLTIIKKFIWVNGTTVDAQELNCMLEDIDKIYIKLGKQRPHWSFDKFRNKQVLKASQLNELIEKIKYLQPNCLASCDSA